MVFLANPIVVSPNLYNIDHGKILPLLFLVALTCLLVEYLATRLLLKRHRPLPVLASFVLVHLITFPITQFFGFFLSFLAEAFPLAVEPFLYTWLLRKFGMKVDSVNALAKPILVANLLSFVLGLVLFNLWPIWWAWAD